MDFSDFFNTTAWHQMNPADFPANTLFRHVTFFSGQMEEIEGKKVAIMGVCEGRNAGINGGAADAPDQIRKYLYELYGFDQPLPLIDLGNIEAGNTVQDTLFAVNYTCQQLLKKGIIVVILGGSQDITYANYLAYEGMEQTVNLVTIDPKLDFGTSPGDLSSHGYLNKIVLHKPNYLFNYSNLGHQRYFTDPEMISLMNKMYFDLWRLGEIQTELQIAEPVIRNADIISFDVSAIRRSEAPGNAHSSPNGFYGDEAAQLCRYAGMSDKLTSFGIYEYNPDFDPDGQTAHLVAQMIWCFLEGVSARKEDYPVGDYQDYTRYIVPLAHQSHELIFYKSDKSDRWWMDVPYPAGAFHQYERHHLVPCTYSEYQQATNEEMPDRWWKTYQKLI